MLDSNGNSSIWDILFLLEDFLVIQVIIATLHLNFARQQQLNEICKLLNKVFRQQPNQIKILKEVKRFSWTEATVLWTAILAMVGIHVIEFPTYILWSIIGVTCGVFITFNNLLQASAVAVAIKMNFWSINATLKARRDVWRKISH
jgi:hypothetical protein